MARWVIIISLAVISAALMAGQSFGEFLTYLAGILLLGFILRQFEKVKGPKNERHRDNE
jgi:hypothetical protein